MLSSAVIDTPVKMLCDRGVAECGSANYRDALKLLELAAAEVGNPARLPGRALAAYGVALAGTDRKRTADAVRFCTIAIERNNVDPECHYALAKVYLIAKSKRLAIQALDAGLLVEREHFGMRKLRKTLGRRRGPVLGFLGRGHPLNVALGRLRNRLTSRIG